ncbi:hypothetical protein [Luteolibacter sp. Populi]|uniref:hypothetical protein n=1 Tax=Luteolibacter sp. Populi TaxID=3230487 RepID=UPI003466CB99
MPAHSTEVDLGILAGSDTEFRCLTLYFIVLDRFAIGTPDKAREDDTMFDPTHQDWHKYLGRRPPGPAR